VSGDVNRSEGAAGKTDVTGTGINHDGESRDSPGQRTRNRFNLKGLPARFLAAIAFIAAYFWVLRVVRVLLVGVLIWPAAESVHGGEDNGLLPWYESGTTGIYVYDQQRLDALAPEAPSGNQADTEPDSAQVADPGTDPTVDARSEIQSGSDPTVDTRSELLPGTETLPEAPSVDPAPSVDARPVAMSAAGSKPYYVFKGFGDQFFLFGGVLLLLAGLYRHTAWLFAVHLLVTLVNLVLLFIGLTGVPAALALMDFLIGYLLPAVSMLWVVVAWRLDRKPASAA